MLFIVFVASHAFIGISNIDGGYSMCCIGSHRLV